MKPKHFLARTVLFYPAVVFLYMLINLIFYRSFELLSKDAVVYNIIPSIIFLYSRPVCIRYSRNCIRTDIFIISVI